MRADHVRWSLQVKGAFVVLVGPDKGEELSVTLHDLHLNVLAAHPRPVILFYGDDVEAVESEDTCRLLPRSVRFSPEMQRKLPDIPGAGQARECFIALSSNVLLCLNS